METPIQEEEEDYALKTCQMSVLLSNPKKKIYERFMLNEEISEDIMYEVMGWSQNEIQVMKKESKIPVKEMMMKLYTKTCEECPFICVSPQEHYDRGSCAPIGILKEIFERHIPGIMDYIFTSHIRDGILKSVQQKTNHESLNKFVFTAQRNDMVIYRLPTRRSLISKFFRKYDTKSMNVLLVDCLDLESDSKSDRNIITKALNLFENIEANFSLFVAPQQAESKPFFVWSDFVEKQIKLNAECVIMVVTPKFAEHFKYSPDRKNDAHRERLRQAIRFSHSCKRPIFTVVFRREDIRTAMEISPFVYELPDQMKFLLLSISQIVQSMRTLGDQSYDSKKEDQPQDLQLEDDDDDDLANTLESASISVRRKKPCHRPSSVPVTSPHCSVLQNNPAYRESSVISIEHDEERPSTSERRPLLAS